MGNFSRDTFNRLKHYVGVRLQQGVPIVDADWNELEDIRKYELQAFLKWFIGNGVPEGNDGFRVLAVTNSNDFDIQGGDGTAHGAGHCLVDGWDVINEDNIRYTAQPLFNNTALATDWGVDPIHPLTTPAANRTDLVYLDVWEREVDSTEDPDHLVNPAIGVETAVRLKREWAVRVVENTSTLPAPPAGHFFYALATLARTGGNANIVAGAITDVRQTGVKLASLETAVATLAAEIDEARGTQANLGTRLDESLTAGGQLRQNVVSNNQVPDGALSESKLQFSASGHNHSGDANGRLIGTNGLADEAVTADKIKFEVVATGSIIDLAPGASSQLFLVDAEYDGRIYMPVITSMHVDRPVSGTSAADVTVQLVYRTAASSDQQAAVPDKLAVYLRITNASSVIINGAAVPAAPVDITWHVYAFAEV